MVRTKAVMLARILEHKYTETTSSYKYQPEKNFTLFFSSARACQHTQSVQWDKTLVVNAHATKID